MANENVPTRSRRALLAAAAAGAAGIAAAKLTGPEAASAVVSPQIQAADQNDTVAKTSIVMTVAAGEAFAAETNVATTGIGLAGRATYDTPITPGTIGPMPNVGVYGVAGADPDPAFGTPTDWESGVYGYAGFSDTSSGVAGASPSGAGVVGASIAGFGVYGFGQWGVYGNGWPGVLGVSEGGTGISGHGGDLTDPVPPANTGVLASASAVGTALDVRGKAKFSTARRVRIAKGASSIRVRLAGVTSASLVIATLQQSRAGVYVQAAVPTTGAFTIYLNRKLTVATYVAYFVIN